jgi:hypothetical protein
VGGGGGGVQRSVVNEPKKADESVQARSGAKPPLEIARFIDRKELRPKSRYVRPQTRQRMNRIE